MLREILSITGKPGLFKIISSGNKMLIVEDLITRKRFPAGARDKVVSLGDIAMYTDSGDKPLGEILDAVYANRKGEHIEVKELQKNGGLRPLFAEIIPDFDQDRVYDSDIRESSSAGTTSSSTPASPNSPKKRSPPKPKRVSNSPTAQIHK